MAEETRIAAIALNPPPLNITDVWVDADGNRMLGTLELFGVPLHAEFLRIEEDNNGQHGCGKGSCRELFEKLVQFDPEGDFWDFEIPGFKGHWVLIITNYKV